MEVKHDAVRRMELFTASNRLGQRLEAAFEGIPATGVPGAPEWAEDPRDVAEMLSRVEAVIRQGYDLQPDR